MLLKVKGRAIRVGPGTSKYKLDLNIPALYLADANYNISLRSIMLYLEMAADTDDIPPQFWSLSTTAVDQTALNPTQEIASFLTLVNMDSDETAIVYYEPVIRREYKIQLPSIHTSEFFLTSLRTDVPYIIGSIEILFEFSKYARI